MSDLDQLLALVAETRARPVAVRTTRDVIDISGAESAGFLQGQLSQDIDGLVVGTSAWTFALAPTGKVASWFRLWRSAPDAFVADVDAGWGEALVERLERFRLRTDVSFSSRSAPLWAVRGEGAAAVEGPTDSMRVADWPGVEGVDLFVDERPDVAEADGETLERLRIASGVPALGAELDADTIPAATGVVDRSVSFTKGCFTGQELVARIDSRGGNAPSRLCGVLSASGSLAAGAVIAAADDGVSNDADSAGTGDYGVVTSAVSLSAGGSTLGLAYIRRAVSVPVSARVGSAPAHLVELPMGSP